MFEYLLCLLHLSQLYGIISTHSMFFLSDTHCLECHQLVIADLRVAERKVLAKWNHGRLVSPAAQKATTISPRE